MWRGAALTRHCCMALHLAHSTCARSRARVGVGRDRARVITGHCVRDLVRDDPADAVHVARAILA